MRYSLTDYILSVKVPDELRDVFLTSSSETTDESANRISIGGDGSYLGNIKTSGSTQWDTQGDATGSWVHNKNKSKVGTLSVEINQLSDVVLKLTRLIETYYSADTVTSGLTLTISKATGAGNSIDVCTCIDCYITKQPDGGWSDKADNMNFEFTCGKITYSGNAM